MPSSKNYMSKILVSSRYLTIIGVVCLLLAALILARIVYSTEVPLQYRYGFLSHAYLLSSHFSLF
jgi:hypothetical protein